MSLIKVEKPVLFRADLMDPNVFLPGINVFADLFHVLFRIGTTGNFLRDIFLSYADQIIRPMLLAAKFVAQF